MNLFQNEIKNNPDFTKERKHEFKRTFSKSKADIKPQWQAAKRSENPLKNVCNVAVGPQQKITIESRKATSND